MMFPPEADEANASEPLASQAGAAAGQSSAKSARPKTLGSSLASAAKSMLPARQQPAVAATSNAQKSPQPKAIRTAQVNLPPAPAPSWRPAAADKAAQPRMTGSESTTSSAPGQATASSQTLAAIPVSAPAPPPPVQHLKIAQNISRASGDSQSTPEDAPLPATGNRDLAATPSSPSKSEAENIPESAIEPSQTTEWGTTTHSPELNAIQTAGWAQATHSSEAPESAERAPTTYSSDLSATQLAKQDPAIHSAEQNSIQPAGQNPIQSAKRALATYPSDLNATEPAEQAQTAQLHALNANQSTERDPAPFSSDLHATESAEQAPAIDSPERNVIQTPDQNPAIHLAEQNATQSAAHSPALLSPVLNAIQPAKQYPAIQLPELNAIQTAKQAPAIHSPEQHAIQTTEQAPPNNSAELNGTQSPAPAPERIVNANLHGQLLSTVASGLEKEAATTHPANAQAASSAPQTPQAPAAPAARMEPRPSDAKAASPALPTVLEPRNAASAAEGAATPIQQHAAMPVIAAATGSAHLAIAPAQAPAANSAILTGSSTGSETLATPAQANPFATLDREPLTPPAAWIHTGATRAEAGYFDPSLGWVSVRAEASGNALHAAIVPASAEAAQALGMHLAGLNTYLADHHGATAQLSIAEPETQNSFAGHSGLDASSQQPGARQQERDGESSAAPTSDPVSRRSSDANTPVPAGQEIASAPAVSGGHISVIA